MPRTQRRDVKAVPKTKTFNGCWTCRARKVKCDGKRPECARCRKAQQQCEGFEVRLYWITDNDTVAPSAIKRQAGSLLELPRWSFGLEEVDRQIDSIDTYEASGIGNTGISNGPFSAFFTWFAQVQVPSEKSMSRPDDQRCCPDAQHSDSIVVTSHTGVFSWKLVRELDYDLLGNRVADMLIANYVSQVANTLTPLFHPDNPYTSIYVPRALNGATYAEPRCNPIQSVTSSSDAAIFFALLATSALHLRSSETGSSVRFDLLAERFRGNSMRHLRKALRGVFRIEETATLGGCQQTTHTGEAILSAILTLITADIMEGSMSEYRLHLSAIKCIADQLHLRAETSPQLERLLTISSFLTTLSDTTSINQAPQPWLGILDNGSNIWMGGGCQENGLEFTYGITPSLVSFMRQMIVLSRNISYYTSYSKALPPSLYSACVAVSEALSQWSIEEEPLARFFSGSEVDHKSRIAQHHVLAFAHGLRVYFHTRILPCAAFEMVMHVKRVAYHLMQIEAIKACADARSAWGTSIVWPGFIASCEASRGPARDVWYTWWKIMTKHAIGNIAHLWTIVQQAWSLKDDEGFVEIPAWMPVLRRRGTDVLAV